MENGSRSKVEEMNRKLYEVAESQTSHQLVDHRSRLTQESSGYNRDEDNEIPKPARNGGNYDEPTQDVASGASLEWIDCGSCIIRYHN